MASLFPRPADQDQGPSRSTFGHMSAKLCNQVFLHLMLLQGGPLGQRDTRGRPPLLGGASMESNRRVLEHIRLTTR